MRFHKSPLKITATQEPHYCLVCKQEIPIGSPAVYLVGNHSGMVITGYLCDPCDSKERGAEDGK